MLFRSVKKKRRQTSTDLTVALNDTLENDRVSSRTGRRQLTEEGYHRCKVTKTTTISRKNRNERLALCRTKLKRTVNKDWCKVIFPDETKIILGKDRKVYMWRKPDEKYTCVPEWVGRNILTIPHVLAMFWGCITKSINGVGALTKVEGNIYSSVYLRVLDDNLWPVISKNFAEKTWILHEDNCPVDYTDLNRLILGKKETIFIHYLGRVSHRTSILLKTCGVNKVLT